VLAHLFYQQPVRVPMLLQPGCSAKSSGTSSNYQHRDFHNRCRAVSTQKRRFYASVQPTSVLCCTILQDLAGIPILWLCQ